MKKFTKIIALVLALVCICTAFAACGGNKDDGNTTKTPAVKVIDYDLTNEQYAFGVDKNQPELVRWMADHKVTFTRPVSHLNYRYATQGGAYVEVNIVADQRLVRPKTNNNEEFLRAGYPAQDWAQKVAQAARQSVSMMDGYLALPAFPIPESKL